MEFKNHDNGVILYGDSIFFGVGASSRLSGCGYLLKQMINIPVEIRSRPGVATDFALENLLDRVLKKPKKYVLVMFGNNDCRLSDNGIPYIEKKDYYINLLKIISQIKDKECTPIICSLQPICNERYYKQYPQIKKYKNITGYPIDWQNGYNEISKKIAEEENIPFINIRNILLTQQDDVLSNDGLHPNDLGHEIIAKTISEELKKIIENK